MFQVQSTTFSDDPSIYSFDLCSSLLSSSDITDIQANTDIECQVNSNDFRILFSQSDPFEQNP